MIIDYLVSSTEGSIQLTTPTPLDRPRNMIIERGREHVTFIAPSSRGLTKYDARL